MLIATQNSLGDAGTYPLPEAQMDRFMMRLSIGYPAAQDEIRMLEAGGGGGRADALRPVVLLEEWLQMQQEVQEVHVHPSLLAYIVAITGATRMEPDVAAGASPRASRDWLRAAQARAYLEGRGFMLPDDLKVTAAAVLHHRIVMRPQAYATGKQPADIVEQLLRTVPVPADISQGGRRR